MADATPATDKVNEYIGKISSWKTVSKEDTPELVTWFSSKFVDIDEDNEKEIDRYKKLEGLINYNNSYDNTLRILANRKPVFVLFNNYFKVKPVIHLEHLAKRVEGNLLDDDKFYDYGNLCLLKLLGFTPRELSDIGKTPSPDINDVEGLKVYRDKLDRRSYQLDAASVRLTNEIKNIWKPQPKSSGSRKTEYNR